MDADTDEVSLLDLLQVVADNLRLLVLGPLAVGILALIGSFLVRPTFTATTQILPPQMQQSSAASMLQSLGALGGIANATAGLKNPTDQYVALLKSRSVQDSLVERFGLLQRYEQKYLQDARKQLANNTVITSGKDGLIAIEASDHEPAFAAELANAYVQELRTLLSRLALTEAQQRRVFFEGQLKQTREKLVEAEHSLNASGLNSSALKTSPQAAIEGLAKLKASITAQEIKLASMRNYLAETAPDFRQAQTELSAMRGQMAQADRNQQTQVGDSDYTSRYRDFKYYETLMELFAKQYEIARVDESREGAVC
ncbi:lipopolysaccharide biosynthesis protein [Rhodoferax lacus]|uniref:Lipopolysaccharide biosynthesis protein n=1 Tax=Rhodoferax lacus TaxID=2184758 RepID=A0A3E1RCH5_9BURK|nr:Wzz/FepE/Etk N-terminal domain-containing protein [Rhodoferax lacus]RFO97065.1 lipopolysaccharide biosynthesis protein [Rhodoferax lacus]